MDLGQLPSSLFKSHVKLPPTSPRLHAFRFQQASINLVAFASLLIARQGTRASVRAREHTTPLMAIDDGSKQAAAGASSPEQAKSRRSLRRLPHVACLALAAAHLARAARELAPRDLAFVAAAHAALALLLLCVGRHEAAPTAEARGRLRVCVWALSTALTGLFACRVAPALPPPLGVLVYGLALLVTAGGFVLLFLCDAGDDGAASFGTREKSQDEGL